MPCPIYLVICRSVYLTGQPLIGCSQKEARSAGSHGSLKCRQCAPEELKHQMGPPKAYMNTVVIDRTPNTFGKNRTEPNRMFGRTEHSAENGPIYRTRSAVLAEHSSVCQTIVRQKNSSVRFGSAKIGFGRSLE